MIIGRKARKRFREAVEKYRAWHPDLWKQEAKIKELLKVERNKTEKQLLKKEFKKTRNDIKNILREIKRGLRSQ